MGLKFYGRILIYEMLFLAKPLVVFLLGVAIFVMSRHLHLPGVAPIAAIAGVGGIVAGVAAAAMMVLALPKPLMLAALFEEFEERVKETKRFAEDSAARIRRAENLKAKAEGERDTACRISESVKAREENLSAQLREAGEKIRALECQRAEEHQEAQAEIRRLQVAFKAVGDEKDVVALVDLTAEQAKAILNLEGALHQESRAREEAEQELAALRAKLRGLEGQIDELTSRPSTSNTASTAERAECTKAVLGGAPTIGESLRFFQDAFPDRVVVLESAMRSAKESEDFEFPQQAFDLLRRLVVDYYEAILAGAGDAKAREVFGKEKYAATESQTVGGNGRAQSLRTFTYKGQQLVMNRHLKIGSRPGTSETLRVHFHWDADDKQIVIGWAGRHLDHK